MKIIHQEKGMFVDYDGDNYSVLVKGANSFHIPHFTVLTQTFLSYCSLGFEFKSDRHRYNLYFSTTAKRILTADQREALETIIKSHNHIVEMISEIHSQEAVV